MDAVLLAAVERAGGVAHATQLFGQGAGIRSIEGIDQCLALREVWLNANPIADLSPLNALPQLEIVRVHETLAAEPPDVRVWKGLRAFSFGSSGTRVELADLGVFSAHVSLDELRIDHANVRDLRPLSRLPLTDLSLTQNLIDDIAPLAGIPSLWRVALSGNPIVDVSPLLELPKLRRVYLADTKAMRSKAIGALREKGVDVLVTKRLPRPH